MTHGRPDWTSSINITGQDLSEVISRPKYGEAETATAYETVIEDDSSLLISIIGTGMIYGGVIRQEGTFDTDYIWVVIVIDNEIISTFSIERLNTWIIEAENMWHVYEKYYSEEYDKYVQGISRGITFETSWDLYIYNLSGSGASNIVGTDVLYALI